MNITITDHNILNGVKGDPRSCPTALAIEQATGCAYINVSSTSILFGVGPKSLFNLPQHVIDFIVNFDMGRPVAPLEFELDIQLNPDQTPERNAAR